MSQRSQSTLISCTRDTNTFAQSNRRCARCHTSLPAVIVLVMPWHSLLLRPLQRDVFRSATPFAQGCLYEEPDSAARRESRGPEGRQASLFEFTTSVTRCLLVLLVLQGGMKVVQLNAQLKTQFAQHWAPGLEHSARPLPPQYPGQIAQTTRSSKRSVVHGFWR